MKFLLKRSTHPFLAPSTVENILHAQLEANEVFQLGRKRWKNEEIFYREILNKFEKTLH